MPDHHASDIGQQVASHARLLEQHMQTNGEQRYDNDTQQ
jgi:hypothetical protein